METNYTAEDNVRQILHGHNIYFYTVPNLLNDFLLAHVEF